MVATVVVITGMVDVGERLIQEDEGRLHEDVTCTARA